MFAVDAGSTQGVAQVIKKYNLRDQGVKGGGYDLLEPTIELLADGQIDFTIDQQPYLQGFLPGARSCSCTRRRRRSPASPTSTPA